MDVDEEHDFDDCVDPKRVELVLEGESSPDVEQNVTCAPYLSFPF